MGRVTLDSSPVMPVTAESLLSGLRDRLGADGWTVTLVALPGVPPALKVGNPAVPMMHDRVMAALMADGSWWFWWGFGERIADAGDLDRAAAEIERVLGLSRRARPDAGAAAGGDHLRSAARGNRTTDGRMRPSARRCLAAASRRR